MSEPRFTMETIKRIFDEKHPNECLEIGMDADTGELVEIRSMHWNDLTQKWDIQQRIAMHRESVDLVQQALTFFKY